MTGRPRPGGKNDEQVLRGPVSGSRMARSVWKPLPSSFLLFSFLETRVVFSLGMILHLAVLAYILKFVINYLGLKKILEKKILYMF